MMDGRPHAVDFVTLPYPGFATDLQPMAIAVSAVADGTSMITENVFEARFRFVDEMVRLGADARTDGHHAVVRGVPRLSSAPVWASDIRAGAGLVLAGLCAEGVTAGVGRRAHRPRLPALRREPADARRGRLPGARRSPLTGVGPSGAVPRAALCRTCHLPPMPSPASSAHEAAGSARKAAGSAHEVADSKPVKIGARVGLLSYGVTHLLIAWIALQVAFGGDSRQASQKGAFQELAGNTFGKVMLWIIVVGFVAVALWRLTLAIWGYRYESDEKKRLRKRASDAGKVVVFAALAVLAATTAIGSGGGGGGGQEKATAGLLGIPGGQLIVGAVGLGFIVAGGSKIYAGWKKKFLSDMACRPTRRFARCSSAPARRASSPRASRSR